MSYELDFNTTLHRTVAILGTYFFYLYSASFCHIDDVSNLEYAMFDCMKLVYVNPSLIACNKMRLEGGHALVPPTGFSTVAGQLGTVLVSVSELHHWAAEDQNLVRDEGEPSLDMEISLAQWNQDTSLSSYNAASRISYDANMLCVTIEPLNLSPEIKSRLKVKKKGVIGGSMPTSIILWVLT